MAEYFGGGHLRFIEGEWRNDDGDIVEIEEVKHGEWIIENFEPDRVDVNYYRVLIKCSSCGKTHFLGTTEYKNAFTKDNLKLFDGYSYCGKCGTKMDIR